MDHDERVKEAKRRGTAAGKQALSDGRTGEWAPLSGEWAGESIPELLGDLLQDDLQDEEIIDAYEDAALEAYAKDDRCEVCRALDEPECDHHA